MPLPIEGEIVERSPEQIRIALRNCQRSVDWSRALKAFTDLKDPASSDYELVISICEAALQKDVADDLYRSAVVSGINLPAATRPSLEVAEPVSDQHGTLPITVFDLTQCSVSFSRVALRNMLFEIRREYEKTKLSPSERQNASVSMFDLADTKSSSRADKLVSGQPDKFKAVVDKLLGKSSSKQTIYSAPVRTRSSKHGSLITVNNPRPPVASAHALAYFVRGVPQVGLGEIFNGLLMWKQSQQQATALLDSAAALAAASSSDLSDIVISVPRTRADPFRFTNRPKRAGARTSGELLRSLLITELGLMCELEQGGKIIKVSRKSLAGWLLKRDQS